MRRTRVMLLILFSGIGCSPQTSGNSSGTPKTSTALQVVQIDEFTFADPVLEQTFRRIDATARQLATDAWDHRPYQQQRGDKTKYQAVWSQSAHSKGRPTGGPKHRPSHSVVLVASASREELKEIRRFELRSDWHPARGWGARVVYSRNGERNAREHFGIYISRDDNNQPGRQPRGTYLVPIPGAYGVTKRFGSISYKLRVSVDRPGCALRKSSTEEITRMLASAEAFRDAGLEEMDQLETLIRRQVESGEAVARVIDFCRARGGVPPPPVSPLDPRHQLTDAQKQEILRESSEEIQRRKDLLREHYREMYAAILRAFPLVECLNDGNNE